MGRSHSFSVATLRVGHDACFACVYVTDAGPCVVAGSKHKTMLEARSGAGPIKAYPRPGAKLKNGTSSSVKGSGLQNKTFHCQICDVHVNSEIQLKQVRPDTLRDRQRLVRPHSRSACALLSLQHISSRRHKDRVAGKPTKPKYSPYSKQQRGSLAVSVT